VNGALISVAEWSKIATYPSFTGELLNLGWTLVYPCPDANVMRELCREYNVKYVEDTPAEHEMLLQHDTPSGSEVADADYLAQIDWFMRQHDEMIMKATRRFGLVDDADEKFQGEIREILAKRTRWEFGDGDDVDEQIIAAVSTLCLAHSFQ
jgi:hypothetical protein